MAADDTFDEITVEMDLAETIVVAFTQRPDCSAPEVDLTGTNDYDTAIAIAAKGLFTLILDSLGMWEPDDDEEEETDA